MSYGYTTITGSSYGLTISPSTSEHKVPSTPSGLIVTQAVQTKDGWLGQVIVDKTIVWESPALHDGADAIMAANARVVGKIKNLLAAEPEQPEDPTP